MKSILVFMVLLYRVTLGRVMGGHCRYHPTCSQYALDALDKYPAHKAAWLIVKRITRCNPFSKGGVDVA